MKYNIQFVKISGHVPPLRSLSMEESEHKSSFSTADGYEIGKDFDILVISHHGAAHDLLIPWTRVVYAESMPNPIEETVKLPDPKAKKKKI